MSIFPGDLGDFDLISSILFLHSHLNIKHCHAFYTVHKYHKISTLHKAHKAYGIEFLLVLILAIVLR